MFGRIKRKIDGWRRRQRMARVRRLFAKYGYPLDHLDDSGVAAALTGGLFRVEQVPLTARTVYFALRRLSAAGEPGGGSAYLTERGKTGRAAQSARL